MTDRFIDLEIVPSLVNSEWSVEYIIGMIVKEDIPAYVRINCLLVDSISDVEDEVKYEIAKITNIKFKGNSGNTTWYLVVFTPIDTLLESNSDYCHVNSASDDYGCERVFGCLKSKGSFKDAVCTEQICLLWSDVIDFIDKLTRAHVSKHSIFEQSQQTSTPESTETPEEFIDKLRIAGERDEIIAVQLDKKFKNLNGYDKMKLINPQKVSVWEQQAGKIGRPKQWFFELKRNGLKIEREREEMTSSASHDPAS